MLGLLLERQKLYRGAVKAFAKSVELLKAKGDVALLDLIRSNYGRVLVQLGDYEDAIKQYQEVKEPSFYTQCGLACAYFKGKSMKFR